MLVLLELVTPDRSPLLPLHLPLCFPVKERGASDVEVARLSCPLWGCTICLITARRHSPDPPPFSLHLPTLFLFLFVSRWRKRAPLVCPVSREAHHRHYRDLPLLLHVCSSFSPLIIHCLWSLGFRREADLQVATTGACGNTQSSSWIGRGVESSSWIGRGVAAG